jgi:DNA-directed RNA polymerase subunit beta
MRDEDDDLLRAAEELGIDLSGVRALAGDAADEQIEGVDATDAAAEGEASAEDSDDTDAAEDVVAVEELMDVEDTADIDLESLVTDEPAE